MLQKDLRDELKNDLRKALIQRIPEQAEAMFKQFTKDVSVACSDHPLHRRTIPNPAKKYFSTVFTVSVFKQLGDHRMVSVLPLSG